MIEDRTQEQVVAALPATFVNFFNVTVWDNVTRVSFGEAVSGGPPHFRAAFMMNTEDALLLSKLIVDLHTQHTSQKSSQGGQ